MRRPRPSLSHSSSKTKAVGAKELIETAWKHLDIQVIHTFNTSVVPEDKHHPESLKKFQKKPKEETYERQQELDFDSRPGHVTADLDAQSTTSRVSFEDLF
ncbi:hypothetical protein ILUMI_05958 [Ignelater luminosus]|uniref:Uncharacterized protein n=1 Tax=Ignelater luminosus TaxID=2038154 RepID=A0A8K0D677_IGNLU|nr:hypothetical protein ILUMI_05958 [Ignelater luminosus]